MKRGINMEKILEDLPIDNIKDVRLTKGGDVNDAYKIYTDDQVYFMLVQENTNESFYHGEIEGLKLFEKIGITAPIVVANGYVDNDSYLLLTFLEEYRIGSQNKLAQLVAKLHKYHSPNGKFGFAYPHNGSAIQFSNEWTDTWSYLFINQRLDKLARQLIDLGYRDSSNLDIYNNVRSTIIAELSNHKSEASLLHGDLWAGNYMFLEDGSPALFDPSPLYGDREFDIGISTVFGGFSDEFYHKYNEIYPLDYGYELRLEFYRLYLLMLHQVKFGNTYKRSVDQSINYILNQRKGL
jgi:hypothetical protein